MAEGRNSITAEERQMLVEMHGDIKSLMGLVKRHDHSLYGNGQPGLCQRVQEMEHNQRDCPARSAYSMGARHGKAALWISGGSLLVAVAGLLIGYLLK